MGLCTSITIQTPSFCSPLLVSSSSSYVLTLYRRYLGAPLTPLTAITIITAAIPRADYCAVSPAASTAARRGQHARLLIQSVLGCRDGGDGAWDGGGDGSPPIIIAAAATAP